MTMTECYSYIGPGLRLVDIDNDRMLQLYRSWTEIVENDNDRMLQLYRSWTEIVDNDNDRMLQLY